MQEMQSPNESQMPPVQSSAQDAAFFEAILYGPLPVSVTPNAEEDSPTTATRVVPAKRDDALDDAELERVVGANKKYDPAVELFTPWKRKLRD
ncbi:hypothetical protein D3C87_855960 [compost metagenome]